MKKKLTDFTFDELHQMDSFLYLLFKHPFASFQNLKESNEYTPINETLINFLMQQGYLKKDRNYLMGEDYNDDVLFSINEKGKIICSQGGLIPQYEESKSKISNSRRANIALFIAGLSFILSCIALFYK